MKKDKKTIVAISIIALAIILLLNQSAKANWFDSSWLNPQKWFKYDQGKQPEKRQQNQNIKSQASSNRQNQNIANKSDQSQKQQCQCPLSQEEKVIRAVKNSSPAVVSIIITKELPVIERQWKEVNPFGGDSFGSPFNFKFRVPEYQQKGTRKQEVGGGTGFIISKDGLILTNKHVVSDTKAEYTVLMNNGKKYPAKVLARDPVQDLAIIKINVHNLKPLSLGDSDKIQLGQTAIAIGNALGEFRNTISVGVISGLKRSIVASGVGESSEHLNNVIQTDAAINPGNSGGPLLDLNGKVIGINVAVARGAQNIGFSLPINLAQRDIQQVKKNGKISYPFLGVRYAIINQQIKEKNHLPVSYGALIIRGQNPTDLAVVPGSPADKAGLQENDIILEVDGTKIDSQHSLSEIIQNKNVGDWITLKVFHRGKYKNIRVKLESR